jgi:hypothetical protein
VSKFRHQFSTEGGMFIETRTIPEFMVKLVRVKRLYMLDATEAQIESLALWLVVLYTDQTLSQRQFNL